MEIAFKKTLFGKMILHVVELEPDMSPGMFKKVFLPANEIGAQKFIAHLNELEIKAAKLDKLQKDNPELFI